MKARILVARRMTDAVIARAQQEFDAVISDHDMYTDEAIEAAHAHQVVAMVIGHGVKLGAAELPRLPASLRIIANPSAGVDHIDVPTVTGAGYVVTNAPDALTDCTADLAFLHILAACRRASEYTAIMRAGWRQHFGLPDMLGMRPSGKVLGIIGMGRIGQAVARRAGGFGMKVIYHNRRRLDPSLEQGAEYVDSLDALLPRCDILSLNLPGGPAGILMTAERFAQMKPGSVFVNTARGSLVDEDALIAALKSGHLYAAGLDVFRSEPDFDLRFNELPNVFLTPHMASATMGTRDQMGFTALDNIAAVLAGKPAPNGL